MIELFIVISSALMADASNTTTECSKLSYLNPFNSSEFYSGRWHVVSAFNQLIHYLDGDCALMDFSTPNEIATSVIDQVRQNRTFKFPFEIESDDKLNLSFNVSTLVGEDYEIDVKVR